MLGEAAGSREHDKSDLTTNKHLHLNLRSPRTNSLAFLLIAAAAAHLSIHVQHLSLPRSFFFSQLMEMIRGRKKKRRRSLNRPRFLIAFSSQGDEKKEEYIWKSQNH